MDEIDCGFDFYAPQVILRKKLKKKPLMFGWFGCGEQVLPTDKEMWRHGLTMARELHIKNGKFTQIQLKKLMKNIKKKIFWKC